MTKLEKTPAGLKMADNIATSVADNENNIAAANSTIGGTTPHGKKGRKAKRRPDAAALKTQRTDQRYLLAHDLATACMIIHRYQMYFRHGRDGIQWQAFLVLAQTAVDILNDPRLPVDTVDCDLRDFLAKILAERNDEDLCPFLHLSAVEVPLYFIFTDLMLACKLIGKHIENLPGGYNSPVMDAFLCIGCFAESIWGLMKNEQSPNDESIEGFYMQLDDTIYNALEQYDDEYLRERFDAIIDPGNNHSEEE